MHCVHSTAQNRPDNFPSYPPDNHHCPDNVYLRDWILKRWMCFPIRRTMCPEFITKVCLLSWQHNYFENSTQLVTHLSPCKECTNNFFANISINDDSDINLRPRHVFRQLKFIARNMLPYRIAKKYKNSFEKFTMPTDWSSRKMWGYRLTVYYRVHLNTLLDFTGS